MIKNIIFASIFLLIVIPMLNAEVQNLGVYKQNECLTLKQSCANCSYTNITSIMYPNSTHSLEQVGMTKTGTEYNYTFCDTSLIGDYIVNGKSDVDGIDTVWSYNFSITVNGERVSLSNIIIVISFLVVGGILFAIGLTFSNDKWILKTFFFLCSLLMAILAMNSARIIASESLDLSSMANAGFILIISIVSFMFLYMMIMWTIETFKSVKEKRGVRWNY